MRLHRFAVPLPLYALRAWGRNSNIRKGLLQAAADAQRFDTSGEPGPVGLDIHPAQSRRAVRRRIPRRRHLLEEALDRLELIHANHGIVVRAGASISLVSCAVRLNLRIGRRHMRMRTDNDASA